MADIEASLADLPNVCNGWKADVASPLDECQHEVVVKTLSNIRGAYFAKALTIMVPVSAAGIYKVAQGDFSNVRTFAFLGTLVGPFFIFLIVGFFARLLDLYRRRLDYITISRREMTFGRMRISLSSIRDVRVEKLTFTDRLVVDWDGPRAWANRSFLTGDLQTIASEIRSARSAIVADNESASI